MCEGIALTQKFHMQHHLKEMAKLLYQGLRINKNGYGITSSMTSMDLVIWTHIVLRRVDMNQTIDVILEVIP